MRGRKSNSNEDWELGWNVFSKATVGKFMENSGLEYSFKDFKFSLDIKKILMTLCVLGL